MNAFLISYVVVLLVTGAVSAASLLFPTVFIAFTLVTVGIWALVTILCVNLFALLVLLSPSVLVMTVHLWAGLIIGGISLAALAVLPNLMAEWDRGRQPFLMAPLAPAETVSARSLELGVKQLPNGLDRISDPLILRALQNESFDWVRLRTPNEVAFYSRETGILAQSPDNGARADVTVTTDWLNLTPRRVGIAPAWAVINGEGYVIRADRRDLARNVTGELLRATKFPLIEFAQIGLENSSDLYLLRGRVPAGDATGNPARTLMGDMERLGLLAARAGVTNTPNSSGILDQQIERILMQDPPAGVNRNLSKVDIGKADREIILEFERQIINGIDTTRRADLIARLAGEGGFMSWETFVSVAQQNPVVMTALVERLFDDIAEGTDRTGLEFLTYGPFGPMAGRQPERLADLFSKADRKTRESVITFVPAFKLDDPFVILDRVFDPFPPVETLQDRLTPEFKATWATRGDGPDIASGRVAGWDPDRALNPQRDEADEALRVVSRMDGVDPQKLRLFVLQWCLTRDYPFQFDRYDLRRALDLLERAGATADHAALLEYFKNFVAPKK